MFKVNDSLPWDGGTWTNEIALFWTGNFHFAQGKEAGLRDEWMSLFAHTKVGEFASQQRDSIKWRMLCAGDVSGLQNYWQDKRIEPLLQMLHERQDQALWILSPSGRVLKVFEGKVPSLKEFLFSLQTLSEGNVYIQKIKNQVKTGI